MRSRGMAPDAYHLHRAIGTCRVLKNATPERRLHRKIYASNTAHGLCAKMMLRPAFGFEDLSEGSQHAQASVGGLATTGAVCCEQSSRFSKQQLTVFAGPATLTLPVPERPRTILALPNEILPEIYSRPAMRTLCPQCSLHVKGSKIS